MELRELVRVQASRNHKSLYEQMAASSLASYFNRYAPEAAAVPDGGAVALEVASITGDRIDAREGGRLMTAFSRAVAMMARDIAHLPSSRIIAADYDRADLDVRMHPAGLSVTFLAQRDAGETFGNSTIESTGGRAMARLGNLIPDADDSETETNARLGAMRPLELRAIHQVAIAAKPMRGISVTLVGTEKPNTARMTGDRAKQLDKLLSKLSEQVERMKPIEGKLDGMRFSRRSFALIQAGGPDIEGVIDEEQMEPARALLNRPVYAHLERITKVRADGQYLRPAYRLVGVEPLSSQPKLGD